MRQPSPPGRSAAPAQAAPAAAAGDMPSVSSAALLGGASMLEIRHAGQRYFLRVTRDNKLILTK